MGSARFWLACGASGALFAACGSDDSTRTVRDDGGAAGQEADAGAPPVSGTGPSAGTGGTPPAEAGAGGVPVTEGGTGGAIVGAGGAGGGGGPMADTAIVEPMYPTNGRFWLDYVKNDGESVTNATDVACAATDGPSYGACVHGGEVRRVALPNQASCVGIQATDALSAFDWICQPADVGVEVVSTGLHEGKHMSDLLDFANNAWKPNSVAITNGDDLLVESEPAAWWTNPIARLPGTMCTADVGAEHAIFLVDAASSSSNCTGATGKIGLASVPGETVTDFRFNGRGSFNWYEGAYNLQAQYAALTPGNGSFQVVRNASFLAASAGTGFAAAISMQAARASVVRNITATGGRTIVGGGSAVGLHISDVTSTGARVDGISLNACTDCSIVRANISDTVNVGIRAQGGSPRLLIRDVVLTGNGSGAIQLSQVSDGRVENVKVARSGAGGVSAVLTSNTIFKSLIVDGAVGAGVSVDQGDDNRLVDIHVGNVGSNGVTLGGNRTVLQHARISCGKGQGTTGSGVAISTTAFGRVQDVTTVSCRYGIDLGGNSNVLQAATVAATEDVGIRDASYASLVEDVAAIDATYGLYFLSNLVGPPRVRNFASTHNQSASIYANNSTLDFGGQLIVGSSGATGTGADCVVTGSTGLDNACGGHNATLTTGASVLASIVGLSADATNPNGASGSAAYGAIVSFTSFDSDTRRFIRAGTGFPDYNARGPCTGTDTCSILDLALKASDTLLRNRNALPTGNDVTTHTWYLSANEPLDQAACDGRVPGSVFVDATPNHCDSVFLQHAWELLEDGIGDNDGFCESNETCEVARNIGGYQGHGALVSAGAFTPGLLTGIALVQRQTNGY